MSWPGRFSEPLLVFLLTSVMSLTAVNLWGGSPDNEPKSLPRFTEEREAAALFFVKKHLPELLPLLEQLKKNGIQQYRTEIREIFQATEWLADLQDDTRRHDLELKIWKAENKAFALAAQLSTAVQEERKKIEVQLQELSKELVDLDVQVLEYKAEQLDKELGEVKDELAKAKENNDKQVKDRYEMLLEKAKKRRK
ncbi:MAG TPA: hypothetical protein VGZ25_00395 [Gemmataceae bacterium]|jgi:hypothetical protein|nr:hypothetical protein [Gemmataceae bacterium]